MKQAAHSTRCLRTAHAEGRADRLGTPSGRTPGCPSAARRRRARHMQSPSRSLRSAQSGRATPRLQAAQLRGGAPGRTVNVSALPGDAHERTHEHRQPARACRVTNTSQLSTIQMCQSSSEKAHFSTTAGHHARPSRPLVSGGARSSGGAQRMKTWWLYGVTVPGAAGTSSCTLAHAQGAAAPDSAARARATGATALRRTRRWSIAAGCNCAALRNACFTA